MTIGIVRSNWSGATGGPGLTQLAIMFGAGASWTASNAQAAVDAVRKFWFAQNAQLPNEVSIQVQGTVDLYDQATGLLTGSVSAPTVPGVVAGLASGTYAGGVGYRFTWATGSINKGRRVVGRTYVVPCSSGMFDSDGTLSATNRSSMQAAGSTLLTDLSTAGGQLVIWSRPPTIGVADGVVFGVASCQIADKTAILRNRRD